VLPDRVIRIDPPRVEKDAWQLITGAVQSLPGGPILVSWTLWKARREELAGRAERVGVWLAPEDDPEELGREVHQFPLIAVHFPKAADGRGYSAAVILRRLGYRGELRAFGDLGRDHLFFLRRCGFDAFSLATGKDPDAALAAFADFSLRYQGSADDPRPLFRRRAAEAARG
jgi:uncharacterized protein (DUF934 family)